MRVITVISLWLSLVVLAAVPAQAQSPDVTFNYASSQYTGAPYNLTSPIPGSGYNTAVYVGGTGYRVTSSYLSDGSTNGNRSCIEHYFGGTFSNLTRFIIVTSGSVASHRLTLTLYDSAGTSLYSQFWDSAPGTRDVTVTRSNVRYARLCLTGQANVNNPNAFINSFSIYGTLVPDGVSFDADPLIGSAPLTVTFTNTSSCPDASPGWAWDFDGDEVTDSTDEDPSPFTYDEQGTYTATLNATCNGALDTATETIVVEGGLTRPLQDSDIGDYGIFDKASYPDVVPLNPFNALSPDPYLVIASATAAQNKVYSVIGGTVESITAVASSCFGLNATIPNTCLLRFDANAFEEGSVTSADRFYTIAREPLWSVVVVGDDGETYEYIVENPQAYLRIGGTISQGCIVGETTPFHSPSLDVAQIIGFTLEMNQPVMNGAFVSRINEEGDRVALLAELDQPVVPSTACNINPDEAACLVNPDPSDTSVWGVYGGAFYLPDGGVQLQPNSQLYTSIFNLVDGTSYGGRFTIDRGAATIGQRSRVALQVGAAVENNVDLTMQNAVYEVDAVEYDSATHDPVVSITNLSDHAITITRICISDGTASVRPDTCAFSNYSFNDGLTDWDYTGSVANGLVGGEIAVANGGTFWQQMTLYPDGASAHTYRVYIKVALMSAAVTDNPTATLRFDYTFGTDTGYFLSPSSGATYQFQLFNAWAGREVTYALDLNISTLTTQNFYIAATVAGSTDFVLVREVCIDDPFESGDWGGGLPPFYSPSCNLVSPPGVDENVGMWTYFLWQSLDRFFQCDLMDALNRLIAAANQQLSFVRWSVRYNQHVLTKYSDWLGNRLLPWLGGHLSNIAMGQRTTILTEQCSDIWCFLSNLISTIGNVLGDLINLLSTALTLMVATINIVLTLIVVLLTQIFGLFGSIADLLSTFTTVWNGVEPAYLPGVPYCSTSIQSSGACVLFWAADQTLFGGNIGPFIMPVLVGAGWIVFVIGQIKKFRKAYLRLDL